MSSSNGAGAGTADDRLARKRSTNSERPVNRTVLILLPAYNEERSLPVLLPRIAAAMRAHNASFRVVVLNDGSTDGTGSVLKELQTDGALEVLTHPINRGLGETIRDLFEHAASATTENDVIVRMDCDDTHDPERVFSMVEKLEEGYDVVIASRFQAGGGQRGVGKYRAIISWCANVYMKIVFPIAGVRDYTSGFRAYRASLIKRAIGTYGNDFVQLKGLGFTCTLEKLIKLHLLGARCAEIPFVLRYDQKQSDSKMVTSITTLGYLVMGILHHWPWGGWRSDNRKQGRGPHG